MYSNVRQEQSNENKKTAIITGSGRGIGIEVATTLAKSQSM
jgi:NAD(P)-dependent dehydrogenase (short-subunit alcohol dehydrogenase family)